MSPELIFKYRYERLGQIIEQGNALELLDLALILRQLFLDGNPLIDQINKEYRIKLQFPVGRSTVEDIRIWIEKGFPEPSTSMRGDVMPTDEDISYLSRDKFLSHPVVYICGTHYSVKDVIDICANKLGGIHSDHERNDNGKESAIRTLNKQLMIGGAPAAFKALHSIGRCVHVGLENLYQLVSIDLSSPSRGCY